MKLKDPDFDKRAYFKKLESYGYLLLMPPLVFFGLAFLERQKTGGLRSVVFEEPDMLFHAVMATAVVYLLMRTFGTWKREILRVLEDTPELDVKLRRMQKPLIYRFGLWALGAAVGAYGLYEKGDMVYALVFTVFMLLITTNRPCGRYFSKFLGLKGEEKKWMEDRKIP